MEKQINKIKYNSKTGEVIIEYDLLVTDEVKITLKSDDRPLEDFRIQFERLVPFVEQICQLPEGFCSEAEVRGVSLSYSHDVMGAVITCLIPLVTANGPMIVNTPHIPADQYNDGGQAPVLPSGCVKVLAEMIIQAERYIDGEREVVIDPQMDIPFNEDNETTISMSVGNGEFTEPITMTEFNKRVNKITKTK